MAETRKNLLDHFDAEVHDRLKANLEGTRIRLDQMARQFWSLTKFALDEKASFDDKELRFELLKSPISEATRGVYHLATQTSDQGTGPILYRLGHPLGQHVLQRGLGLDTPFSKMTLDVSNHPVRIAPLLPLVGKQGLLHVQKVEVSAFDIQEYLLVTAMTEDGETLDPETSELFFSVAGSSLLSTDNNSNGFEAIRLASEQHVRGTLARNAEENNRHFIEVKNQLDRWAQDMEEAAEKEIKDCKARIRDLERQARQALTMDEKLKLEKETAKLEERKTELRRNLFNIEDEIRVKRKGLIEGLERRLKQKSTISPLFTLHWSIQ
jgi:hypothetical protein